MPNQQLPERTQRIIAHLQDVWQRPQPVTPDDLKRITEFVLGLPEQYKQIGLAKIARYSISNMSLHILNLLTVFQQYAEQEGLDLSDVQDTLDHILPETFRVLSDLDSQMQVQSLDDVATLTNITASLQVLSSSDTAEEAQSWLYELPTMYYQQLSEEKLTINNYTSTHIPQQQVFSSTPIMNSMTHVTRGDVHISYASSFPTFTPGIPVKNLKPESGIKDHSERGESISRPILAA